MGNYAQIAAGGAFTGVVGSFSTNDRLYIAANGGITRQRPTSGWIQILGRATSSADINYRPGLAGLLTSGPSLVMATGGTAAQATSADVLARRAGRWMDPALTRSAIDDAIDDAIAEIPAPQTTKVNGKSGPTITLVPNDLGLDAVTADLAAGVDTVKRPTVAQVKDIARPTYDRGGLGLPQIMTPAERDRDGSYSLNNWIAPASRSEAALGRYAVTYDAAPALRAALASGEDISVPRGEYRLNSGKLTFARTGQRLRGAGRESTVFTQRENYDISSGNLIRLNHHCQIEDVCFHQSQNDDASNGNSTSRGTGRADLIAYPWVLDQDGITRVRMRGVRLSQVKLGVLATNNSGGSDYDGLEIGALETGFLIDGAQDFMSLRGIHFWPFGIAARADMLAINRDGTYLALDVGMCESLDAQGLKAFGGIIRIRRSLILPDRVPFGSICGLSLDGNVTSLQVSHGRMSVSGGYSTKDVTDGTQQGSILVTGGTLLVSGMDIDHSGPTAPIYCTGGKVIVSACRLRQYRADSSTVLVEGTGEAVVLGCDLDPLPGGARSAPMLFQAGTTSTLRAIGNTVRAKGPGESGEALRMANNGPTCVAAFNDFGGWALNFANNGGRVSNNV